MPMMDSEELEKAAEEDEWVKERLKEFRENMDLNHDNICDKEELEVRLRAFKNSYLSQFVLTEI